MIESKEGLKEDLAALYEKINDYNNSIVELINLGELGTQKTMTK